MEAVSFLNALFPIALCGFVQTKAKLSMEKVYLALQSAGLAAEKTKLETDCRDSSAELKRAEVRDMSSHTRSWVGLSGEWADEMSCVCAVLCCAASVYQAGPSEDQPVGHV